MTNYKEILRLHSLGINNTRVAESCSCARSTVISTVQRAQEKGITWEDIRSLGEAEVARKLYPATSMGRQYKMPDYEYIHQEMQKSGVTLSLLWVEYCEQCRSNGELPYQSTQFNKYYADFVHKTKATLRLEHKPGEPCKWTGPVRRHTSWIPIRVSRWTRICLSRFFLTPVMPTRKLFWT